MKTDKQVSTDIHVQPPGTESDSLPAPGAQDAVAVEHLMPYGMVAKAIFVKANGLPAYQKARFARRSD